ncbi:MAG: ChbG/HpnK family deacetylase, partial [Burkholderiaceae bacterium]
DTDYRSLMQAWLAALPSPGGLLFCHPGLASNPASDDPIGAARQREFAYLASEAFRQDMQAAYVMLVHAWP